MMTNKTLFFVTVTAFLLLLHVPTKAAKIENIFFPNEYTADNVRLEIRGTALLRYMIFVKAYVGGLYLPENIPSDAALSEVPKRLEVEYFQAIKGKDFGPVTLKMIARNVDAQTFEQLQPKIELHNSLYEDVKPGDRYSLTYIPGKGTELALNGETKGIIEGSDFAAALFSIWLGPEPIDKNFKSQILGLR